MNLGLAFWAPYDVSPEEAEADVRRQALEWADAEPNVVACEIVNVDRHPERPRWYDVAVVLTMKQEAEQTSWLAA